MNKKAVHTAYTDRAWNQLYYRLETDGLLDESALRKRNGAPAYLKWVAMIGVIFGGLATYMLINQDTRENYYGLTTFNNEAGSLVKTLEDGSVIYLGSNAQLHYPESFLPDRREVYLEGNALFDVTGNRERPFYIETGTVMVEVIGTSFEIRSEAGSAFELAVREGVVGITGKYNGQQTLVKAGETAILTSNGLFSVFPTDETDHFTQYINRLRFKDESLDQIIGVINRNHPETHLAIDPGLKERKLTIAFADNTPEEMVRLICLGLKLNYKIDRNDILISE